MLRASRVAAPEVLAIERENLPYQKLCTAMPVAQRPLCIASSCETVEDKSSFEAIMSTRLNTRTQNECGTLSLFGMGRRGNQSIEAQAFFSLDFQS